MTKPKQSTMTSAQDRLGRMLSTLKTDNDREQRQQLGTLTLGSLKVPVFETNDKSRLPREHSTLDWTKAMSAEIVDDLEWMLQKNLLGQDMFLIGAPGPYARRLANTFASLLNKPIEFVALHRDVGEADLKQSREIRRGGSLEYVDSAAVRAAKLGSILVLDGIERCERGVLPTLNNLLENREINLEDGTHIVSADRYDKMIAQGEDTTNFIPAHREFRVVAIGTPCPPYPGYPLDPPFRSRFQARYLDPLSTGKILAGQVGGQGTALELVGKTSAAISTIQISREMKGIMASGITSDQVPMFPQTTLSKMSKFLQLFPPPVDPSLLSTEQAINMLLSFHPSLAYMDRATWRSLDAAFESAHAGDWFGEMAETDPASVALSGQGIMGWSLESITRSDERKAKLKFSRGGVESVEIEVAAGPLPFASFPLDVETFPDLFKTPRFDHLLTSLFQLHALGDDIAFVPPSSSLQTSSGSTSMLISTFAALLGYELETFHLYKELGGRELLMRRVIETDDQGIGKGVTRWEPSMLTTAATEGSLVHLESIDTLGPTANSIGRLLHDREAELWEGKRLLRGTGNDNSNDTEKGLLSFVHPSFKIIATPSKSQEPKMYLTEELASNFVALPSVAMSLEEEKQILLATGCAPEHVDVLETFARAYRRQNSVPGSKSRRLGTASLVRIAKRLASMPNEDLHALLNRTLLSDFLPQTDRVQLASLFEEVGIKPAGVWWNPPAEVRDAHLVFPAPSAPNDSSDQGDTSIRLFDLSEDPTGASHVPFMNNYLDNSQQTALLRDIAVDLEVLGEHVLLLGNQGVGKNKIIDRLLQLLQRPREFIQLHRDTTTQSLMFQTTLEGGVIRYVDSPLLRAVQLGRVLVIDEVDKAPTPVVAALASLASRGEMTLADGRKIRPESSRGKRGTGSGKQGDLYVHPSFRLVLLANRPGNGFLGNNFTRVLGDHFAPYAVANPDVSSEQKVLSQLAPELSEDLLRSLVAAFADLRTAFENGTLAYPFSLRELLALVRHMRTFPDDPLESTLRNVFDFDALKPEVNEMLYNVLRRHKLNVQRVGMDAVRAKSADRGENSTQPKVIDFTPKDQGDLDVEKDQPKFGKVDDKQHTGGNTWAGGTGGKSTAGLGGRGGYMRLYKPGTDINQIPDSLKANVPEEIKAQAREMARKELAKKLQELELTTAQAGIYSSLYDSVSPHIQQLVTYLDNLEANEEERVWLKRQGDGDLDESRLAEGLTGEATIYKRRGFEKPEVGRPQVKPKRIRFVMDLSASMYRNQYDGRLSRSLEAAVMILESFGARISRKEKYRIDLVGHSGEEITIPLVPVDTHTKINEGDRFKVVQKMSLVSQFCWAGDHTLEAIEKGVEAVATDDADDWFVIAITDANFGRYGITATDLKRVLNSNPKVKTSLIAIGEGAEVEWLPKVLPGQAHRVKNTGDIATTLRTVLSSMLGGEL
ncbi:hypothetical protein OIO90_003241 [Microbotryomycetes sp. JL221]|nr:hypothetical protein OIO90_003241 [Microbotryomycetes sp. JL221]